MKSIKLLFILFFTFVKLHSAGPVIHLYLAQKWCHMLSVKDEKFLEAFYRGTLFPDIRYLTTLNRQQTHSKASLDRVYLYAERGFKGDSKYAFAAGMIFHSVIDYVRESFVLENKVYDLLQSKSVPRKEIETFLKLIEDELFFDITPKDEMISYLHEIGLDEQCFMENCGQKPESISLWHENEIKFLSHRITNLFDECNATNTSIFRHIPLDLQAQWNEILPLLLNDFEVVDAVAKTIMNVEHYLIVEHCNSNRASLAINERPLW